MSSCCSSVVIQNDNHLGHWRADGAGVYSRRYSLKTFYIDWLTPCRKCGRKDAEVKTIHGNRKRLWEDDDVKCRCCGLTGVVQACEGYAWCVWAEVDDESTVTS